MTKTEPTESDATAAESGSTPTPRTPAPVVEQSAGAVAPMSQGNRETRLIHKRLHAVLSDCKGIAKERKNEQQHYRYRGIDQVAEMLHPLFARHGVVMLPSVEELQRSDYQTSRGNTMQSVVLRVRWDFVCAEDGSTLSCTTVGEGSDSGDKASNKAMTAAQKYALTLAFTIPWSDQQDGDRDSPEPRAARAPQRRSAAPPQLEAPPPPEDEHGGPPLPGSDTGDEAWLDEKLGFSRKYADHTWRELTQGSPSGGRASFLLWMCDHLDPTRDAQTEERHRRAMRCADLMMSREEK